MRVLIVDDTTFMRMTIRRILEPNGFIIVGEAEDGLEALKKYKVLKPDLVVMDISMPVMDGIEAVKEIKKVDSAANIIICSLQGQRTNVLEAIKAGARSYLIKPIKAEKLLNEIKKIPMENRINSNASIQDLGPLKAEDLSDDYLRGLATGYMEARREVATNMLRLGVDIEFVMNCTEMSKEEIEEYKVEFGL